MAGIAFEIVADIKMGVGQAMLESERVKRAIGGISRAANDAQTAIANMGLQFASSLGLGGLSLAGGLLKSISLSEKFNQTVNTFAGIITGNMDVFAGDYLKDFNNRIALSTQLMHDLSAEANRIGTSESDFFRFFKEISYIGLKGGLTLEQIKTLASHVTVAAPIAGINKALAGHQITQMALRGAAASPTLWKMLVTEAPSLEKFQGRRGMTEFGQLSVSARMQILATAFKDIGDRPELLARQLNTIGSQMDILRNHLVGMESVLMPLGDILRPILIDSLRDASGVIDGPVRGTIQEFANILRRFVDQNLEMMKDMHQASQLDRTRSLAAIIIGIIPNILLLGVGLQVAQFGLINTTKNFMGLAAALEKSSEAIRGFVMWLFGGRAIFQQLGMVFGGTLPAMSRLTLGLRVLGVLFVRLNVLIGALFIIIQTLIRAGAEFRINMAKWSIGNMERVTRLFDKFLGVVHMLWSPFQGFIEQMGSFLGTSIITVGVLEALIWAFERVTDLLKIFARGVMVIRGIAAVIGEFLGAIVAWVGLLSQGKFAQAADFLDQEWNPFEAFFKQWEEDEKMMEGFTRQKKPTVSPKYEHHGDVNIFNDIKEAFEPDRIAFTVSEQIKKALTSPKSAVATAGGGGTFDMSTTARIQPP